MKKYQKFVFILALVFLQTTLKAASVDTVSIYSTAMHTNSKCIVILPQSYNNSNKHFPVVYLLHGYSGNYSDWVKKVPKIKKEADEFQIIIVCPDGHYNSWYFDSPVNSSIKYETYISTEVPNFIDSHFHTIAKRNYRAIAGLSMGGHGALSIAWRHPDFFGAVGSMSGVVDLTPWKNKYELTDVLGDTLHNNNFYDYSVVNLMKKIPAQIPAIIFDCGINDPFIENNRKLHGELLKLKIPHDYTERNGTHNWDYWSNAVCYQLLFFHKYFIEQTIK
ncbi:MAG: alpha/beta hydrolase family protein [Bacteroidota bacterium]|nr:alpha/beta hydrolase family protein [Bacteroidota bacterium]